MNYVIQNTSLAGLYSAAVTVGAMLTPALVILAGIAAIIK